MRTRTIRRAIPALLACAIVVLPLTACAPAGRAVGDTQDGKPEVAHESTRTSDAAVGFVGSADAGVDRLALDALADSGIDAFYAAPGDTSGDTAGGTAGNTSSGTADSEALSAAESASTAQQSVNDFVARAVEIVVISGIDVNDANQEGWNKALNNARDSGIPVALINPRHAPEDELLYAATLKINDRAADATPLGDAVMAIVRDEPHERTIMVTTLGASS
jgi:ABC-type sugar transport system substrate-binding protein